MKNDKESIWGHKGKNAMPSSDDTITSGLMMKPAFKLQITNNFIHSEREREREIPAPLEAASGIRVRGTKRGFAAIEAASFW